MTTITKERPTGNPKDDYAPNDAFDMKKTTRKTVTTKKSLDTNYEEIFKKYLFEVCLTINGATYTNTADDIDLNINFLNDKISTIYSDIDNEYVETLKSSQTVKSLLTASSENNVVSAIKYILTYFISIIKIIVFYTFEFKKKTDGTIIADITEIKIDPVNLTAEEIIIANKYNDVDITELLTKIKGDLVKIVLQIVVLLIFYSALDTELRKT